MSTKQLYICSQAKKCPMKKPTCAGLTPHKCGIKKTFHSCPFAAVKCKVRCIKVKS